MIYYDGVVYSLQSGGGVSVLFNELIERMPCKRYFLDINPLKTRFHRYLDCKISNEFDIFHSTYYRLPSNYNGKVVTTVHDFTYEKYSRGLKKKVHAWQKKRAVKGADLVICVSENTKCDLLKYYGDELKSRIRVVYNGVSDAYHTIENLELRNQVLFVGARDGYKNFLSCVLALSTIDKLELVCVGGGGFSNREVELLEEYLPNRYRHVGFITNEELNKEYNQSVCLLYTSLYEGFGIPVLEAMKASCPVIAVNASSIPEVAGDAAYLLDKGNPEEIRQGIKYFLVKKNRDLHIQKGLTQSDKFSWDRTYLDTLKVYEELLGYKIGG